jgi:hypothetical protein
MLPVGQPQQADGEQRVAAADAIGHTRGAAQIGGQLGFGLAANEAGRQIAFDVPLQRDGGG